MRLSALFLPLLIPCCAGRLRPPSHAYLRHSQRRAREAEEFRFSLLLSPVFVPVLKQGALRTERRSDESTHRILGADPLADIGHLRAALHESPLPVHLHGLSIAPLGKAANAQPRLFFLYEGLFFALLASSLAAVQKEGEE